MGSGPPLEPQLTALLTVKHPRWSVHGCSTISGLPATSWADTRTTPLQRRWRRRGCGGRA